MNRRVIFKAASQVAARYGDKWARMAGDKAVKRLSALMEQKGLADRTYDLESLTAEFKEMYRQGRFNKEEWGEIKSRLQQAWKERKQRQDRS